MFINWSLNSYLTSSEKLSVTVFLEEDRRKAMKMTLMLLLMHLTGWIFRLSKCMYSMLIQVEFNKTSNRCHGKTFITY